MKLHILLNNDKSRFLLNITIFFLSCVFSFKNNDSNNIITLPSNLDHILYMLGINIIKLCRHYFLKLAINFILCAFYLIPTKETLFTLHT